VVERGGLENRCASNRTGGSNPPLSATKSREWSVNHNKICIAIIENTIATKACAAAPIFVTSQLKKRSLTLVF
jgi:hypothetical protein